MKNQYIQEIIEIKKQISQLKLTVDEMFARWADKIDKLIDKDKIKERETFYAVFSNGSPLGQHYIIIHSSTEERAREYMGNSFGKVFGKAEWRWFVVSVLNPCYRHEPLKTVILE